MSILSLIEKTGHIYKKKASTHGGEYSGPCPWCGGDDRFSIHPEKDHFVCRQCKKAGSSITFMMKFYNQKYFEACSNLNITPDLKFKAPNTTTEHPDTNELIWKPREIELPSTEWQNKAAAFLFESYKFLLSPAGKPYRDWLNNRGISNNTIKSARMGWNAHSVSFDLQTWGLAPVKNKTGKNKQIWIPEGLIIPQFINNKPVRLRIRRPDVSENRFIMVYGSASGFFNYSQHLQQVDHEESTALKPIIITEAELDGWLLQQELSELFQVYAIGNSSARPDLQTHENLSQNLILLNLDDDDAGKAEVSWWVSQYPHTLPWFSSIAKDPGEDFEYGVNIRQWGEQGLKKLEQIKKPKQKIKLKNQNFKEKIIQSQNKNQKPISKPKTQKQTKQTKQTNQIKKSTITGNICAHGMFCQSLKKTICLISKKNPFETLSCPKDQWYPYTSGVITEIILAPGVNKT